MKFKKKMAIEIREKLRHKLQITDNCNKHANFLQFLILAKHGQI